MLSIDPGKVEELLSSAGARSYGVFSCNGWCVCLVWSQVLWCVLL